MFYKKKPASLPQKNVTLRKASPTKSSTKLVKEALKAQQDKHQETVSAKERIIRQQKEIMLKQQEQLQRLAQSTLNQKDDSPKREVIELRDVQKLQELDVNDRYNVLEYLVKELIGLKIQKNAIDHSSSSVSHHPHHAHTHHSKEDKHLKKPSTDKKPHSHKKEAEVESISVDSDAEKVVLSSSRAIIPKKEHHREEWEEDLTSTQNLALSGSAKKKGTGIVEPTIKLNNFVAPIQKSLTSGVKAGNKFSSIRKGSDQPLSEQQMDLDMLKRLVGFSLMHIMIGTQRSSQFYSRSRTANQSKDGHLFQYFSKDESKFSSPDPAL